MNKKQIILSAWKTKKYKRVRENRAIKIKMNNSACYVVAGKINMKVVIVGAGVAGLSTFLQLRKVLPSSSSNTIRIYEAHEPQGLSSSNGSGPSFSNYGNLTDTTAVIGNSIALVPSSIRLLKYIDARLYGLFKARGYENESYTFKTARGHRIAVTSTSDNVFPTRRIINTKETTNYQKRNPNSMASAHYLTESPKQ